MSFEATALILAWGAIAVLAFAMAGLLRQVRALTMLIAGDLAPAAGPQRGQVVPAELVGGAFANGGGAGRLLVFMDGDCPVCEELAPQLAALGERGVGVRLVFRDGAKAIAGANLEVLEGMSESFERLGVPATPYVVRVGQGGTIADAAPIGSPEALRRFVEREEVSHELI
jgi:hypothetical protein